MDQFRPSLDIPLVLVLASMFIAFAFVLAGRHPATTSEERAKLSAFLYPVGGLVVAGAVSYGLATWWQGAREPLVGAGIAVAAAVAGGALAGWALARWTKLPRRLVSALSARSAGQRQVVWIVCSFALALIATWPLARLAFTPAEVAHVPPATKEFWNNFYINWTASLLFWVIVGLVGALVALTRPEDLPFAERVRILFGGSHSKSAADMETLVREIGQINQKISRKFRFLEWDAARNAVLVEVETLICVKNLLKDVESVLVGDVVIEFDKLDPPPVNDKYGEFQRYRTGPKAHVTEKAPREMKWPKFVFGHQRVRITPAGTEDIDMKACWWTPIGTTYEFSFISPRFTQCMDVKFERDTSYKGADIIVTHATGDGAADLMGATASLILNGTNYTASLPERNDILARQKCYEFTLTPRIA